MNIIEENGKKMAAVLCVASCFPVVATVYAMETDPGWHGDKYISEDATVVKGWQEIGEKAYYFSEEDGTVDKEATEDAVVATISTDITGDVQEVVKESTVAVVEEAQAVVEEEYVAPVEETEVVETPVEVAPVEEGVQEYVEPVEEYVAPVEEYVAPVEETSQEEYVEPAQEYVEAVEEYVEPAQEYVEPVSYVEETTYVDSSNPYSDLNARIASAAKSLVDVTDGEWCTEVVQQALALAGVQDAYQLWPDEYCAQYGYYTDSPEAGNLIYYYNGGRGVDHIAVYIGDGLAVHGNYNGETVIASDIIPGGAPQYIQVCR